MGDPLLWQPTPEGVAQICALLTEYRNPAADQAQIFAQLKHCESIPDFCNYLSYIFVDGSSNLEVRQSAGLLLKNNLRTTYAGVPDQFRRYIRGLLLPSLASPNKPLRHTAGTIVSVVVGSAGLAAWPELVCAFSSPQHPLPGPFEASISLGPPLISRHDLHHLNLSLQGCR